MAALTPPSPLLFLRKSPKIVSHFPLCGELLANAQQHLEKSMYSARAFAFGAANGYAITTEAGNGKFLTGQDTHEKAQGEYDKIITNYESSNPGKAYRGSYTFASRTLRSGAFNNHRRPDGRGNGQKVSHKVKAGGPGSGCNGPNFAA
jgi:hypothetical protein